MAMDLIRAVRIPRQRVSRSSNERPSNPRNIQPSQAHTVDPETIEKVREHIDYIYNNIFKFQAKKHRKIWLSRLVDHNLIGAPIATISGYYGVPYLNKTLSPDSDLSLFIALVLGAGTARVHNWAKRKLESNTKVESKDFSNLAVGLGLAFDRIYQIRKLVGPNVNISKYLSVDDLRKVHHIKQIGAKIDQKLRSDRKEIDRNAYAALYWSEYRMQARRYLKRMQLANVIPQLQDYDLASLTKRWDQGIKFDDINPDENLTGTSRGREFMQKIFAGLYRGNYPAVQNGHITDNRADNGLRKRAFRSRREKNQRSFLSRFRARRNTTSTAELKVAETFTPAEAFRITVPKLRTRYVVDALESTLAGPDHFQYPDEIKISRAEKRRQERINRERLAEADFVKKAMGLINDIKNIMKKQLKLEKRTEFYPKIAGLPSTALAFGIVSSVLGDVVTAVRDLAVGRFPREYNWLVGSVAGYFGYRAHTGILQRYVEMQAQGKDIAARVIALWLMEEKAQHLKELLSSLPDVANTLKSEQKIRKQFNQIMKLAQNLDERIKKARNDAFEDAGQMNEYNERVEEAQNVLKDKTDYPFLVPVLQAAQISEEANGEAVDPTQMVEVEEEKNNDVLKARIDRFYKKILNKNNVPQMDSFGTIIHDLIEHPGIKDVLSPAEEPVSDRTPQLV